MLYNFLVSRRGMQLVFKATIVELEGRVLLCYIILSCLGEGCSWYSRPPLLSWRAGCSWTSGCPEETGLSSRRGEINHCVIQEYRAFHEDPCHSIWIQLLLFILVNPIWISGLKPKLLIFHLILLQNFKLALQIFCRLLLRKKNNILFKLNSNVFFTFFPV